MSDKRSRLTKREIALRGTIIALIVTVPSLVIFGLIWVLIDDLIVAAVAGAIVHFIAMGFSLKISKRLSKT